MSDTLTVRACTLQDVPTLAKIENECFSVPWNEGLLAGAFSRVDFLCFIMEEKGEAVGYICGTSLFEDSDVARVAVVKSRRGEGHGGTLLNAFIQAAKAKGARRVFLEVRVSNATAIRLYERNGFTRGRIRVKYYANGEDGLEMKKDLY